MWTRLSRPRQSATVAAAAVAGATVPVAVVLAVGVTTVAKPEEIAALRAGDDNQAGRLMVEKAAIPTTMP